MAGKAENGSGIETTGRETRPSTAKTNWGKLHAANPNLFCNGLSGRLNYLAQIILINWIICKAYLDHLPHMSVIVIDIADFSAHYNLLIGQIMKI